jgi:hypothetical protein
VGGTPASTPATAQLHAGHQDFGHLVRGCPCAGPSSADFFKILQDDLLASLIPRHPFPAGNTEEGLAVLAVLQENAQKLIDGLETGSAHPGDALSTALTPAKGHCPMAPRASFFPTAALLGRTWCGEFPAQAGATRGLRPARNEL